MSVTWPTFPNQLPVQFTAVVWIQVTTNTSMCQDVLVWTGSRLNLRRIFLLVIFPDTKPIGELSPSQQMLSSLAMSGVWKTISGSFMPVWRTGSQEDRSRDTGGGDKEREARLHYYHPTKTLYCFDLYVIRFVCLSVLSTCSFCLRTKYRFISTTILATCSLILTYHRGVQL